LCGSDLLGGLLLACFKASVFNLEDQERPDRPSITDEDQIKTLIENNPRPRRPIENRRKTMVDTLPSRINC